MGKEGASHPTVQPAREWARTSMEVGDGFPGLRVSDVTIYPDSALRFLPRLELMIANIFLGTGTG